MPKSQVSEYTATLNRAIFGVQDKELFVKTNLQNKMLKDSFAYKPTTE